MSEPPPSAPAFPAAPSRHAQRWAAEEQPRPVANPKGSSGSNSEDATQGGCWRAKHQRLAAPRESLAMPRQVGGARSGARPGPGRGHTYESTMPIETQFLFPPLPTSGSNSEDATQGGCWRAKHQRLAAPRESLAMPRQVGGARSGARPGPGRGHTYESTMPIETQFLFPPLPKTVGGNWLEQLSLRKKWQTERIEHLERQVEELLVVNATQAAPEEEATVAASRWCL
eukprot:CAMPEP_0113266044 /NCGR_PEP_ID=MMETSP0008_2-20120614/19844_1 /TAXON_ID=97485 /ORGANISM="Prymnesium parvum" /LENGTH=227 /DNA_ID=CAMNT_0000114941 /DNA_START=266 /DNA_END=947 /DNA_ORIENTATION=+ /assembly_acc=CAM_ASM_000153